MLIADNTGGALKPIERFREGVRPLAGLLDGSLTLESIRNITDVVANFAAIAIQRCCATPALIATAAIRGASNSNLLAQSIYDATGISMRIVSGDEEARLSLLGASSSVDCDAVIDIGGGSTEIAYSSGDGVYTRSMDIGAVRLLKEHPQLSGKVPYDYIIPIISGISDTIRCSVGKLPDNSRFAGVGGTITTLAKMYSQHEAYNQTEGATLSYGSVKRALHNLCGLTLEHRKEIKGLSSKRADIILSGCIILYSFMIEYEIERISVTDRGNLDGLLISLTG